MRRLIITLALALCGFAALAQELDREAVASAEVNRYLRHWARGAPRTYRRAVKLIPSVVQWSTHYDVDSLLVARLMSCESSWRQGIRGARGEWGLMQLLNKKMLAKYPEAKTDADTNIRAGCELLRECMDSCPSLKSAIGCYGAGHCTEKGQWLDWRYKTHLKDVSMFRLSQ